MIGVTQSENVWLTNNQNVGVFPFVTDRTQQIEGKRLARLRHELKKKGRSNAYSRESNYEYSVYLYGLLGPITRLLQS